jgi:pimeloyl-ACP methyl ester carboxylesterase
MARFVLIHGAFMGGWSWGPLVEALEARGHTAEAPDLPGSGSDPTPPQEVTFDAYVDRVTEVLEGSDEPAILVGNSMGGLVATAAAVRSPERVAGVVHAGSFAPQDGQSLMDITHLPEAQGDQVQANLVVEGEPPVATMPDGPAKEALYNLCSDEVAAWAIGQHTPQAAAPLGTPVSIPAGALDEIPLSYVVCTGNKAIMPALQRRMSADVGCESVIELEADHTPQLSATDELADALDRLAG